MLHSAVGVSAFLGKSITRGWFEVKFPEKKSSPRKNGSIAVRLSNHTYICIFLKLSDCVCTVMKHHISLVSVLNKC